MLLWSWYSFLLEPINPVFCWLSKAVIFWVSMSWEFILLLIVADIVTPYLQEKAKSYIQLRLPNATTGSLSGVYCSHSFFIIDERLSGPNGCASPFVPRPMRVARCMENMSFVGTTAICAFFHSIAMWIMDHPWLYSNAHRFPAAS